MSRVESPTQREIDSAWHLWQALMEHAETLWFLYEEPFSKRILRQQKLDEMKAESHSGQF